MKTIDDGIWATDEAKDVANHIKKYLLEGLKGNYSYIGYMAIIDVYSSLPFVEGDWNLIAPYIEQIENQDYENWDDPDYRRTSVSIWIKKIRSKFIIEGE